MIIKDRKPRKKKEITTDVDNNPNDNNNNNNNGSITTNNTNTSTTKKQTRPKHISTFSDGQHLHSMIMNHDAGMGYIHY